MRWDCLALFLFASIVSAVPIKDIAFSDPFENFTEDSFLEVELGSGSTPMKECRSYGDTHVLTSLSGAPLSYFNVMGTKEWQVIEGPKSSENVRKWQVQGHQTQWANCGTQRPDITVMKDIAVQCGDWYVLFSTPEPVHACIGKNGYQGFDRIPTRVFIKGKGKDGFEYDGRNYYGTKASHGAKIYFTDEEYIHLAHVGCPVEGCRLDQSGLSLDATAYCQGTSTRVFGRMGWAGGSFLDTSIRVPEVGSSQDEPIRCSVQNPSLNNMAGGYCGCWNDDVKSELQNLHSTCRGLRMAFWDPNNHNVCDERFQAPRASNIFSFFDYWTTNLPNPNNVPYFIYQSMATDMTKGEASASGIIYTCDEKEKLGECKQLMEAALGHALVWENSQSDPRVYVALTIATSCAEDMCNGMAWDVKMSQEEICDDVGHYVEEERKDIYCAFAALDEEIEQVDPEEPGYLRLLENARTTEDVTNIKAQNRNVERYSTEVRESLAGIKYWYESACEALIEDTPEIETMNCQDHVFVDTSKMSCPNVPPSPNAVWDGICADDQPNGGNCNVKCSSTSERFPFNAATTAAATCNVVMLNGHLKSSWDLDGQGIQCCTGGCDKPLTQTIGSRCESGKWICQDCPNGQAASDDKRKCIEKKCPANTMENHPTCGCLPGYKGTISWNRVMGDWDGECVKVDCPANSDGFPECKCDLGYAGRLSLSGNAWDGQCLLCPAGTSYSDAEGKESCSACSSCSSIEREVRQCTSFQDRICVCKPGFEGTGDCQGCTLGFTYSTDGTACKDCTKCNSVDELVIQECTLTTDTICRCNITNARGPCGDA